MKEISVKNVRNLTEERLKEELTDEQKEILINSKFDYKDVLNEIQLIYAIFTGREDILINVEEIFTSIKNNGVMPIEKLFGVKPKTHQD